MAGVCDNNRVGWRYVSDDTNNYGISAKHEYVTQMNATPLPKLGGEARQATDKRIPKDMRPRFVYFTDTATKTIRRRVVCYTAACDAFVTPGTTLNLCIAGASVACESTNARRAEYRRETTSQVEA